MQFLVVKVETINMQFTDKRKNKHDLYTKKKKILLLVIEGKQIKIELPFLPLTLVRT